MTHPSDLPIGELLVTVFNSILEVFILCLAGYVLARKGVLDKKTQRQLNHLNTSLFTPALLFSKVALSLTPQKLRELYVLPIFFLLTTCTSLIISLVLSRIFGLKRSQKNFAVAASMFMNSNSLPVALMGSLVAGMKGLKWRKPGQDDESDSKDAMLGRALTYLVLASTMGMILRWSFGVRLLAAADDEEPTPPPSPKISYNHQPLPGFRTDSPGDEHIDSVRSSRTLTFPTVASSSTMVEPTSSHDQNQPDSSKHLRPPPPRRQTTYFRSFPNSPNQSVLDLSADSLESSRRASVVDFLDGEEDGQEVLPGPSLDTTLRPHHPKSPKYPLWKRLKRRITRAWRGFTSFMTIPLYASLLSIVVALTPPLQHALENHMAPVKGALKAAGSCSIPITLVVLGGYFWKEEAAKEEAGKGMGTGEREGGEVNEDGAAAGSLPKSTSSDTLVENVKSLFRKRKDHNDGERIPRWMQEQEQPTASGSLTLGNAREVEAKRKGRGETKTVIVAILSRMVLTPLVLMPVVVWCVKVNDEGGRMWVPVFEDPIFILSITLLLASPPALTLAQITQASAGGGQAFERLISRTIFWSYCVVTPPAMVLWVVVGLIVGRV